MRRPTSNVKGFSLTELTVAIAAAAVLFLVGWASWEMGWRETWASRARTETSRNTFVVLQRISNEVMRAHYRDMYQGKGDKHYKAASHQVVYNPKSGDFLFAHAQGNPYELGKFKASAYSRDFHKYNLFDLLNSKP